MLHEGVHAVTAYANPTSYDDLVALLQAPLVLWCSRSSCGTVLKAHRGFVRIWNVPAEVDGKRNYCARCARKIVEAGWMRNEVYDPTLYAWREWIKNPEEAKAVAPQR